jgi:hypothetical protein
MKADGLTKEREAALVAAPLNGLFGLFLGLFDSLPALETCRRIYRCIRTRFFLFFPPFFFYGRCKSNSASFTIFLADAFNATDPPHLIESLGSVTLSELKLYRSDMFIRHISFCLHIYLSFKMTTLCIVNHNTLQTFHVENCIVLWSCKAIPFF